MGRTVYPASYKLKVLQASLYALKQVEINSNSAYLYFAICLSSFLLLLLFACPGTPQLLLRPPVRIPATTIREEEEGRGEEEEGPQCNGDEALIVVGRMKTPRLPRK